MPINYGRQTKPPRPQGHGRNGMGKYIGKDEGVFLPKAKHDEVTKLIAEAMVTIEQQETRITELEAENLVLKDRLLQAEFDGDESVKPPRPPEPPGPMYESVWG